MFLIPGEKGFATNRTGEPRPRGVRPLLRTDDPMGGGIIIPSATPLTLFFLQLCMGHFFHLSCTTGTQLQHPPLSHRKRAHV